MDGAVDAQKEAKQQEANAAAAKAFVKFLYTPAAQKIWAQNGYRPVVKSASKGFSFPVRPQMFTIKFFGGWKAINARFFDPSDGVMAKIIGQR